MIEQNINELDKDFMSLWAKFLLDDNLSKYYNDLEKLAELGQINAIIEYFRTNPKKVNPIIAHNLNENQSQHFNVLYAKALQSKNEELKAKQNEFLDLLTKHKIVCNKLENYDFICVKDNAILQRKIKEKKLLEQEKKEIEAQIFEFKFVKFFNQALAACIDLWKNSDNALALEMFCECGFKNREIVFSVEKPEVQHICTARKMLFDKLCERSKDPAIMFALGKNLLFYSRNIDKNEGARMLKRFAKQKYSATFENYKAKSL